MPPLPPAGNVVRIDWLQSLGEDTNVITRVFWSYAGSGATLASVNAIATAAQAAWAGNLEPGLGTFHSLQDTTVTDLSSDTGPVGVNSTPATGIDAGDPLAADTAMRLKFIQARRYRGGHPGVYLGGFVEDRLADPQTWSDATITEFTTRWADVVQALEGVGDSGATLIAPVAISYYHGFTVQTSPSTGRARNVPTLRGATLNFVITAFEIDKHVSSQRRRSQIRR